MNGAGSYFELIMLINWSVLLAVSIYRGKQDIETQTSYYSRLMNLVGLVIVTLGYIIEEPYWLSETLFFVGAGLIIPGIVIFIRGRFR